MLSFHIFTIEIFKWRPAVSSTEVISLYSRVNMMIEVDSILGTFNPSSQTVIIIIIIKMFIRLFSRGDLFTTTK